MVNSVEDDGASGPQDNEERAQLEAADWFARLSADCVSEDDYLAYRKWRASSPQNAQSYDKTADMWAAIGGQADAPSILEMRVAALADAPPSPASQRSVSSLAAIAAAIAVLCAVTALITFNSGHFNQSREAQPDQSFAAAEPAASQEGSPSNNLRDALAIEKTLDFQSGYSTKVGQMAKFQLPDGSVIELNTGSEVQVDYSTGFRNLTLKKGEAVFTVAKDPSRPFIVTAGSSKVVALGTVFSVRTADMVSEVTLIEGRVRIDREGKVRGRDTAQLTAGEKIRIVLDQPFAITRAEPSQVASWRNGRLIFEQTPLREVLDEFNRYSSQKHVLVDENLAALPVSGTFRIRSSEHFAATLEAGFPVVVRARAGGTVFEVIAAQESQPIELLADN